MSAIGQIRRARGTLPALSYFIRRSTLDVGCLLCTSAFLPLRWVPLLTQSLLTFYSQTDYDYEHEFFIRDPLATL